MSLIKQQILLGDRDWKQIADSPCIVSKMHPGQKGSLAAIELRRVGTEFDLIGLIFHKKDFENLLSAFKVKDQGEGRIVVIEWSTNSLTGLRRIFSPFLPRLSVYVFAERSFELSVNPALEPQLTGEARFLAELPLAVWTPI